MVGDKVRIDVREVLDHHGDTIVRGAYDGEFDKANLPEEVILSNYFSVRDGKIVSLVVIFNQPCQRHGPRWAVCTPSATCEPSPAWQVSALCRE